MGTWIVKALCFAIWLWSGCCAWSQDSLFKQLINDGVALGKATQVRLAPPLLMNSQPDQAKELLNKLARRHGWEQFAKDSSFAPICIDISHVEEPPGKRIGHNIYSAFIAYSPLETLKDQELMASLFGSSAEDKELIGFDPQELSADILQKAGIKPSDQRNVRYSTLRIPLMNRVVIEGTARIEKQEFPDSIIIAWELEPHFTLDPAKAKESGLLEYANRYTKEERNQLGKVVNTEPVSYSGCGGYISVKQTGLANRQLLVESHMAMYEPDQWFAGSNFLRSKFPEALKNSAQSFRRKLSTQNKPKQ